MQHNKNVMVFVFVDERSEQRLPLLVLLDISANYLVEISLRKNFNLF